MKKLLFVTYIASALLLSTTVRADVVFTSQAQIEKVAVDPSTQTLMVYGTLANPCAKALTTMSQDEENPNVLIVNVASLSPQGMCIAMVQDYNEIVSLPALVGRSPVQIDPNQAYVIKVLNFDFEYQISGAELYQYEVPGMQIVK